MKSTIISTLRGNRFLRVLKELCLCGFVVFSLLIVDRSLENIYPYFLYGTGKRIIDLWISFEMHMHVWLKWLIPAVFLVWIVRHQRKARFGVLLPVIFVYLMYLVTSFLTISGITYRWWNTTELPMLMLLFITVQCSSVTGIRRLSFCGNCLYSLLLLFNAIFCVFPQLYDIISGWRPEYFLSADNLTGFPMIFGLVLAFLDGSLNSAKSNTNHAEDAARIRKIIYLVLFYLNLALIHCVSALVAGFILTLYIFIPRIRLFFEKHNLNLFTVISLVLCGLLVGFSCITMNGYYDVVESLFASKMSVIIRVFIWYGSFLEILRYPLLGYGLGYAAEFYLRPYTTLWYNAHNAWLQTLHEGGIVVVLAVLLVLFLTAQILKKSSNRRLVGLFSAAIFAELIMMQTAITAWFVWAPLFVLLQMASLLCSREDLPYA